MGYQDRDYMRGAESGGGEGRSNPLWWILGLIALILVVAYFRRGAMAPALEQAVQSGANVYGPLQTCRCELADGAPGDRVLSLLRAFFREQGWDAKIHETADATLTTATFFQPLPDRGQFEWSKSAMYQRIGPAHASLKARHTLFFQIYGPVGGAARQSALIAESLEVSRQLRTRLEAEFPGIVLHVDDTPQPAAYDGYE